MKKRKWTLLTSTVLITLVLSTSCKKEGYILPVKPTSNDTKKASENQVQINGNTQTANAVSTETSDLDFSSQEHLSNLGACEIIVKDNPDLQAIANCAEVMEQRNGGEKEVSGDTTAADLCVYRDLSTKDVFVRGEYVKNDNTDKFYEIDIEAKQSFKTKSFDFKDGKTRLEYMGDESLITLRRKAKLGGSRDRINALIHCEIFE